MERSSELSMQGYQQSLENIKDRLVSAVMNFETFLKDNKISGFDDRSKVIKLYNWVQAIYTELQDKRDSFAIYLKEHNLMKMRNRMLQSLESDMYLYKKVQLTFSNLQMKLCSNCSKFMPQDKIELLWRGIEFCGTNCFKSFQHKNKCFYCSGDIHPFSFTKYCRNYSSRVQHFCCSICLNKHENKVKMSNTCCQVNTISAGLRGFVANVGHAGCKDFCTNCIQKSTNLYLNELPVPEKTVCIVCNKDNFVRYQVQIDEDPSVLLCSALCFSAFKYSNVIDPDHCANCSKYYHFSINNTLFIFHENKPRTFCNDMCLHIFVRRNNKIFQCTWCKVNMTNFNMIMIKLQTQETIMICSLYCLNIHESSMKALQIVHTACMFCNKNSEPECHLIMANASIHNFCTYRCAMHFQNLISTRRPITMPLEDTSSGTGRGALVCADIADIGVQPENQVAPKNTLPVISSVMSLAEVFNEQHRMTEVLSHNAQTTINNSMTNIHVKQDEPAATVLNPDTALTLDENKENIVLIPTTAPAPLNRKSILVYREEETPMEQTKKNNDTERLQSHQSCCRQHPLLKSAKTKKKKPD